MSTRSYAHLASLIALSLLFIAAGVNHFVRPDFYLKIMPDYLPLHLTLVYLSGFFEIAGGAGLMIPRLRRAAGWGLIALLIAVLPANVNMLINADEFAAIPLWLLIARVPLQAVLIVWVWWTAVKSDLPLADQRTSD